jgi:hypothetical protein
MYQRADELPELHGRPSSTSPEARACVPRRRRRAASVRAPCTPECRRAVRGPSPPRRPEVKRTPLARKSTTASEPTCAGVASPQSRTTGSPTGEYTRQRHVFFIAGLPDADPHDGRLRPASEPERTQRGAEKEPAAMAATSAVSFSTASLSPVTLPSTISSRIERHGLQERDRLLRLFRVLQRPGL